MITDILFKIIRQSRMDTGKKPSKFILNPGTERNLRYELSLYSEFEYERTRTFMGIPIEISLLEKNIRGLV